MANRLNYNQTKKVRMMEKDGRSDASRYRALARAAKSGAGKHPARLLNEARFIRDPYFASLALFELSGDSMLEPKKALSVAREAIVTAGSVERLWRRAELLSILAKKIGSWGGDNSAKFREMLLDNILEAIVSMPNGKGLSDAIAGCAPSLGCNRLRPLLAKAVLNKGFEVADTKTLIRHWAQQFKAAGLTAHEILNALTAVKDAAVCSRLMGYLYLQCDRSGLSAGDINLLHAAIKAAVTAKDGARLDALRYLAGLASTKEELEAVSDAVNSLAEPVDKARLIATLGGAADKAGLREMALALFKSGLELSSNVDVPRERVAIRMNLAQGFERCEAHELARQTYHAALDDCGGDEILMTRIHKSMDAQRFKQAEVRASCETSPSSTSKMIRREPGRSTNNILALYDTYEGGLKPVHFRAVARAAPLCAAFGLDLALMGFPTKDLDGLVAQVIAETNIGRSGRYLRELMREGRVVLVTCTQREPPLDWKELGLPVATTSHPSDDRKIGMMEALQLAKSKHPLRRLCLLVGLGKRGLPQTILDVAQYHLELTGRNVPLETCTAIGVIAQQLRSEEDKLRLTL